jgi:hypothetical protein
MFYCEVMQAIYTRTNKFDSVFPILAVEDVAQLKPPALWLNIEVSFVSVLKLF